MTLACPSPTQMVWTLKEPYEGYLTLLPEPAAASTTLAVHPHGRCTDRQGLHR